MKNNHRILTKVYIVEDSASIRARLVEMLNDIDGVSIVGEAETPLDAIEGILETQPDCVVLDYQLIGGTGVEVVRTVHPISPAVSFIVMTNHPDPQYRRICVEAGASEFFDKSTEFWKIKDVISQLVAAPHLLSSFEEESQS
jgi:DNA-binding NarL/FixJ family response regulator